MTSRDVEHFSTKAPYQFLGGSSENIQNQFKSATHIHRSKDDPEKFVVRVVSGRSERKKDIGAIDYTLGDTIAGIVWCEEDPEVGDAIRMRELDFTDLEMRTGLHTILKKFPPDADGVLEKNGQKARYEMRYSEEIAKIEGTFLITAGGLLLSGDVSGALSFELTTAEEAQKLEASLDLFESTLIKVDQSLGDPAEIRELILEITGSSAAAIKDSANQSASYDEEAQRLTLKVGRKYGRKIPVNEEARMKALEETTEFPTKDPQVIALTEKAIGGATRTKAKIKRLIDFVDEFIIDDTRNEPLSVNDIIETQRGDCTEHSQLFVTMARAAGIPARTVSGFIYGETSVYCFGGHAWCEVEVDGHWHPVDPSWGETMINATHIRISSDRPSAEELEIYMGGLKFRVISVTDKKGNTRKFAKPAAK